MTRPAVSFVLLLLALLAGALPAGAAGTGGINISPYPGVVDGKPISAFHAKVPASGSTSVRYALRNTTDHAATARLFATKATRDSTGRFTIGSAGSSPYVHFTDGSVTLKPREVRLSSFSVTAGPHGRPAGKAYAALVVEVRAGSVIQQAATVVYLEPGPRLPLPLLVVLIAAGLLALVGLGLLYARRRRA